MGLANKSLSRGLRILRSFNKHSRPSLAELAASADIPKPTALRYLQTLVDEGYVALNPVTKRYSLRPCIVDLGMAALASLGIPRQMESELERLAMTSGGSAHLGVLDGTDVIIMARSVASAEHRRFVTMQIYVGSRLPAFCTGLGRILLANAPDAAKEAVKPANLVKLTPRTETNPARIMKILQQAERDGYATTEEELGLGYSAIAIMLGTYDKVAYAIGMSLPSAQFDRKKMIADILPLLLDIKKSPD